jgi:hypothetical protein
MFLTGAVRSCNGRSTHAPALDDRAAAARVFPCDVGCATSPGGITKRGSTGENRRSEEATMSEPEIFVNRIRKS